MPLRTTAFATANVTFFDGFFALCSLTLFLIVVKVSSLNLIELADFELSEDFGLFTLLPDIRSFLGAGVCETVRPPSFIFSSIYPSLYK